MDEDRRAYSREYMRKRREKEGRERPDLQCAECGKSFPVSRGNNHYCSDECGRAARLRRRREREYQPDPINCANCGELIPYKSGKRRFCSDDCRAKFVAIDARWRAKGIAAGGHGLPEHCGICARTDRALVIDHDHGCCPGQRSCGRCVRGFLCRQCNGALGMFLDDPKLLRKAAEYVERTRQIRLI